MNLCAFDCSRMEEVEEEGEVDQDNGLRAKSVVGFGPTVVMLYRIH